MLALTPADFDFKNRKLRINKSYQRIKGQDVITEPKQSIENNLHWCLDVIFKENASRARKDNSPLVLNIMRKIALNFVSQTQYKHISKRRLMFRAALEPTLFLDILFDPSAVSPQ